MAERDSFIIYRSFIESARELNERDRLKIYEAMFDYGLDHKEPQLKGMTRAIFTMMKPQLDANYRRFICGCKGGAPLGNGNARKQPKTTKNNQKQPNVNVNVNDNVNENVNVNVNQKVNVSDLDDDGSEVPVDDEIAKTILKLTGGTYQ